MSKDTKSLGDLVSFPVSIHQTENSFYIKVGNDESAPEDFQIILDDGQLIIASAPKRIKNKTNTFSHMVQGKNLISVDVKKDKSKEKSTLTKIIEHSVATLKSVLFL